MDGMDDMNAPMPPMDANMPPMDDPAAQQPGEDPMGGEEPDPLAGDPNALNAGNADPNPGAGGDIQSKYNQLSPDQQKAADKYIDSMMNNESRFNFKHIIDEVFGERDGNVNPMDKGTTRFEKKAVIDDEDSPYTP